MKDILSEEDFGGAQIDSLISKLGSTELMKDKQFGGTMVMLVALFSVVYMMTRQEREAGIKKDLAEADKLTGEGELARANADKVRAEADKVRVETDIIRNPNTSEAFIDARKASTIEDSLQSSVASILADKESLDVSDLSDDIQCYTERGEVVIDISRKLVEASKGTAIERLVMNGSENTTEDGEPIVRVRFGVAKANQDRFNAFIAAIEKTSCSAE